MTIAQDVYQTGQKIAAATSDSVTFVTELKKGLSKYLGWPCKVASGSIVDLEGMGSDVFDAVVHLSKDNIPDTESTHIAADFAAVVIDITDKLDLDNFGEAYARITLAKRLKKAPAPKVDIPTSTNTLGVIYARRSVLTLEQVAEEFERLNDNTPGREWPDMVVLESQGIINYAVQFPGESLSGDYLPPAENALNNYIPSIYVVIVMRPVIEHTFNKMVAFIIAHLHFFTPGTKLPNIDDILENVPSTAVVIAGYQYDIKGNIKPVPRQFYQDRYIPAPPYTIEDQHGQPLATVLFIPWQDGGVIMLKGKLPLLGLLPFLGKQGVEKGGVINRNNNLQISYVLPINESDFRRMLNLFQQRSNMKVREPGPNFIVQKMSDEGTRTPFIARLFLGLMRLRDTVYYDAVSRENFDKAFDFIPTTLTNARTTAKEICDLWTEHNNKVTSGKIVTVQSHTIHIDENIDKDLKKQVEQFLNALTRALKHGMQNLTAELDVDIGFLFKKQNTFEKGINTLKQIDPLLASYLEESRFWSERLVQSRNDLEHNGWVLPRVGYHATGKQVTATEPNISNQPVTEFVKFMLDRVCCFVEEVTAHCLQQKMPPVITITEIKISERRSELPLRFRITPAVGGAPRWDITYHSSTFDNV